MSSPTARLDPANRRSGQPPLDLGAVQIVDIVADGQRVQMVMERTPTVCADAGKLAKVTTSLLRTALQASSPTSGPIEVEVASRCLGADHGSNGCTASVSVAVRTRGRSFAGQTTDSFADANEIIRRHRGRLWVADQQGEGQTAGFCLTSEEAA